MASPRRFVAAPVFFVSAAAILLAACAPGNPDCARAGVWCAGLVTDFGSVQEGINGQAWLALQDSNAAGLLDRVDFIETVDSRDRGANIRTFAEAGYDIIITVGASISEETAAAAGQYPDVHFIGVEQSPPTDLPNVVRLVFHEEHSGFLAGVLAALVSQTGRVAAVCEAQFIDSIRRYCEGFRAGAVYADPDVHASLSYREGATDLLFRDPEWGREAALEELQQGADILFAAGGETADAALLVAAENGALVIGSETDAHDRLPAARPRLLTSAINDVRSGVRDLLQLAQQDQLPSGQYFGRVDLALFHDLEGEVPAAVVFKLAEIRTALQAGEIRLDIPYAAP